MKKLSMILAACAVAYLAIPIVADAQQTGVDRWGHAPVAPRFVSPDGGRVQGRASADGDQYVTGTVTANMVAPDGGLQVAISATLGGTNAAVQCSHTAPTLLGGLAGRRVLSVQNLGPNPIYLCPASTGCTTASGTKLSNGDPPLAIDATAAVTVYCIAATATQVAPADTRIMELK